MTEQDLNDVIAGFREALRDYVKGDPEPAMSFFSRSVALFHQDRNDVTLANPLEPPRRGPAEVGEAARRAAANFQVGGPLHFEEVSSSFEEISRFATSELGYVLQIERHEGRVAGHDDTVVTVLRATLVFRYEDGVWKITHRHADPITSTRPLTTLLRS
jgi:ketosteroid isomerase-like protein